MGTVLRNAWTHIEALQTTDIPLLVEYITGVRKASVSIRSIFLRNCTGPAESAPALTSSGCVRAPTQRIRNEQRSTPRRRSDPILGMPVCEKMTVLYTHLRQKTRNHVPLKKTGHSAWSTPARNHDGGFTRGEGLHPFTFLFGETITKTFPTLLYVNIHGIRLDMTESTGRFCLCGVLQVPETSCSLKRGTDDNAALL